MVKVRREPDIGPPYEACCFCRESTPFWYFPELTSRGEVACCEGCAGIALPEDMPTKKEWCRRERIVAKSERGDWY